MLCRRSLGPSPYPDIPEPTVSELDVMKLTAENRHQQSRRVPLSAKTNFSDECVERQKCTVFFSLPLITVTGNG